jgi:hypothetical protein
MASAPAKGKIFLYATSPNGHKNVAFTFTSTGAVGAGGSPDGVLANKTADKQVNLPRNEKFILTGGWKVQLGFELDAADGMDASDATIQIPLSVKGAGVRTLTAADLGYTVDYPAATPANEVCLGDGYTIPNGEVCAIGGGPCVIAIEDDA